MNILIARNDTRKLKRIDQVPYNDGMRYYYVADPEAKFHLVSRVGPLELLEMPATLDAAVGWGEGWHGKCHSHHEGLKLMKVTLYRPTSGRADERLGDLIRKSREIPDQQYTTRRWRG